MLCPFVPVKRCFLPCRARETVFSKLRLKEPASKEIARLVLLKEEEKKVKSSQPLVNLTTYSGTPEIQRDHLLPRPRTSVLKKEETKV